MREVMSILVSEDAILAMRTCRRTLAQLLLQVHPPVGATCLGIYATFCLRYLPSDEASCYYQDHILHPGLRDR